MHDILALNNVSFIYSNDILAIDHISFSVNENEKVAFIGPNGAGKSTLFTLLNGVQIPTGKVVICGETLAKNTLKSIRSKIGIVFQNPDDQLFSPTVFEDVAFGPMNFGVSDDEIPRRVERALEEVGLPGYEQRSSLQMSYGEKKLVSIATVLSSNPAIVALDEPTSNLDPFHRRKIIDWIKSSERTVLIATHDLDMLAETVERIFILKDGKIHSEGYTMDILTNKSLLEQHHLELPLSLQGFPYSQNVES
jgi:cobalt/nickel transport system ATP-binding protein